MWQGQGTIAMGDKSRAYFFHGPSVKVYHIRKSGFRLSKVTKITLEVKLCNLTINFNLCLMARTLLNI